MNSTFDPHNYLKQKGIHLQQLTPGQALNIIQRLCTEPLSESYRHMSPEYYRMVVQAIELAAGKAAEFPSGSK
jgi:hypothetical protein